MEEYLLPLRNSPGSFCIVDKETYDWAKLRAWTSDRDGYVRCSFKKNGKTATRFIHRLICGEPEGLEIDHINHNRLDNRRCNLRPCTRLENVRNKRPPKSGVPGVGFRSKDGKWRTYIYHQGKQIWVGAFAKIEDAILYKEKKRNILFGINP